MSMPYRDAVTALDRAYGGVTELVAALTPDDLLAPTRCRGWLVADVLFHLLSDAQRALVALHTPDPGPADTDHVSYWRSFPPGRGDDGWANRLAAAAFGGGTAITRLWLETAPAAVDAATRADPGGFARTQGKVLAVPDLVATFVLEAVVHHLDMTVAFPAAAPPARAAVELAGRTLADLAGEELPISVEVVLEATGRTSSERPSFPLLG
ncbi:maleylpyruvate isomerase N-terminal domain-containing protein [Dactylosporangium sp. NPDC051541]|uniref:maleylpyruvate isomerase N-terminal domain-containing protein n=1 Tax=Dactylosporangium sp. NPDC051541 TaxID=3363977 RepID=UPI00378F6369